ncbi:MAG: tetratricopeptide repeat protein [Tepidisphaeraceae bacterium]
MTVETLQLAQQHHAAGRLPQAEALYLQIISAQPDHAEALARLGQLYLQLRKFDEATGFLRRAVAVGPDAAGIWSNLGIALQESGKSAEAIEAFQHASSLQPQSAELLTNLGSALRMARRFTEAEAACRKAVALQPKLAIARDALGNVLSDMDRFDEAIRELRKSVKLRPDVAEGHYNLAVAFKQTGRWLEAVEAAQRAMSLRPNYIEAATLLGYSLASSGRIDEALDVYRNLVATNSGPRAAVLWNNLGNALKDAAQLDAAIDAFHRALSIKPQYPEAHSNLILTQHYHPGYDAKSIAAETRRWDQANGRPLKSPIPAHENDRNPDRRLRIGYVSPDFRNHPVGRNLLPLLTHRDRDQFEVFCYSNLRESDAVTDKFRAGSDAWREIIATDDARAAQTIRQDRIDILMDLAGHTAHNRLTLFAHKPAPVQATFGAYPGGAGLQTIDWRFTDPFLEPPELGDGFYRERVIRLPHSFWCYDPEAMDVRQTAVAPLPAEQNGYVTFGCLNNFCKINVQTLRLWSQVLSSVPGSRLVLLAPRGSARTWVLQHLAIDPGRVQFVPLQPRDAYLRTYDRIDIGLDTLPYNGHTTSLDSLWMGVPVLTLIGATAFGRAGWSQLSNLNLTEWAARDESQFVKLAADLAGDWPRLAELRRGLRPRMEQSPLTSAIQFTRNVESAYRKMWRAFVNP